MVATFWQWLKGSREVASEGPTAQFFCLSNNSKWKLGAQAHRWQQYSMHGCMVDLYRNRATSGERNFIEWIKVPIFLEAVLAIEIMQEPQSNLEEKVNPSILKDDFPQEQTHPF